MFLSSALTLFKKVSADPLFPQNVNGLDVSGVTVNLQYIPNLLKPFKFS